MEVDKELEYVYASLYVLRLVFQIWRYKLTFNELVEIVSELVTLAGQASHSDAPSLSFLILMC